MLRGEPVANPPNAFRVSEAATNEKKNTEGRVARAAVIT